MLELVFQFYLSWGWAPVEFSMQGTIMDEPKDHPELIKDDDQDMVDDAEAEEEEGEEDGGGWAPVAHGLAFSHKQAPEDGQY